MGMVSNNLTRRTLSGTSVIGDSVVNSAGESLGKIKDLMIDIESGRIAYAVLSFGGVLGLGDKLFAVPWSSMVLDAPNKQFVMSVAKDTLERAPGFDKDHWPDFGSAEFGKQIYGHYGQRPYWE
jgi:sporulation protein YlmC with PRC-barrel domain